MGTSPSSWTCLDRLLALKSGVDGTLKSSLLLDVGNGWPKTEARYMRLRVLKHWGNVPRGLTRIQKGQLTSWVVCRSGTLGRPIINGHADLG